MTGYKNLIAHRLSGLGRWPHQRRPRASTLEALEHEHRKGLVALTGCLGGWDWPAEALLQRGDDVRAARTWAHSARR
jgi:DNA polymerase III alpha subunit